MQAWTILTAIALVAAIPMAFAATPEGCDETPPQEETLVHPLDGGRYIRVSADGVAFWKETNGHEGLQTQRCIGDSGSAVYQADERADGIVLA